LRLWDVPSSRQRCILQDFSLNDTNAGALAFSPDSRTLAIGDVEGVVRLWNADTGKHLATFECHADASTNCLALSSDGKTLATWGNDGKAIKVWDIGMELARTEVRDPSGSPTLSRNGLYLAVWEKGPQVRLWDLIANRACAIQIGARALGGDLTISPDGRTLAALKNDLQVSELTTWDLETGKAGWSLKAAAGTLEHAEYSPDGGTLASGGQDGSVRVWGAADGKEKWASRGLTYPVGSLALSSDGRVLAAAGAKETPDGPVGWEVRVWDTASAKERATFRGKSGVVQALAVSPDGSLLAAAGSERVRGRAVAVIRLWDLATGQELPRLWGRSSAYCSVAFTRDGKGIAAGSEIAGRIAPGDVDLWDAPTGQLRASLRGHPDRVTFVAFTPDGNALVSASDDGTVKIWDATPLDLAPEPVRK
jgi:WD40 repeat protein